MRTVVCLSPCGLVLNWQHVQSLTQPSPKTAVIDSSIPTTLKANPIFTIKKKGMRWQPLSGSESNVILRNLRFNHQHDETSASEWKAYQRSIEQDSRIGNLGTYFITPAFGARQNSIEIASPPPNGKREWNNVTLWTPGCAWWHSSLSLALSQCNDEWWRGERRQVRPACCYRTCVSVGWMLRSADGGLLPLLFQISFVAECVSARVRGTVRRWR